MRTGVLLCLLFLSSPAWSQINFSAVIIGFNGEPLSYTNIASMHYRNGTMSNLAGRFSISTRENDTLIFTHISHEPLIIPIKELLLKDTIFLSLKAPQLPSIIIKDLTDFKKEKEIGFYHTSGSDSYSLGSGSQLAIFINNPEQRTGWIKWILFKIKSFGDCKHNFRIRVLELDTLRQMPGKDLLPDNLIIPHNELKKKNKIDISKYRVMLPKDGVFVVIEWISTNDHCIKPTSIAANHASNELHIWFNFRDRKWVKQDFQGRKSGTPKVSIIAAYP